MFTKTNKGGESPTAATGTGSPAQDAIRPASAKPTARPAASLICADMTITGSVLSDGSLQIDGTVEGDVQAADITIGSSGVITGEVKAELVRVKGTIRGSIRARKVELETGAKVEGDIVHSSLSIQANAVFEGQVKHANDPLKDSAPRGAYTSAGASAAVAEPARPADPGPATTTPSTQSATSGTTTPSTQPAASGTSVDTPGNSPLV